MRGRKRKGYGLHNIITQIRKCDLSITENILEPCRRMV